jgi:hypothetical protein
VAQRRVIQQRELAEVCGRGDRARGQAPGERLRQQVEEAVGGGELDAPLELVQEEALHAAEGLALRLDLGGRASEWGGLVSW